MNPGADDDVITLVLDGLSLRWLDFDDKEQISMLLAIAKRCSSVIACRLTPLQKQFLVRLGKNDPLTKGGPTTTLAIGDGANDIDMIKYSGLGIAWNAYEKVRTAADVSIGHTFKSLLYFQGFTDEEILD